MWLKKSSTYNYGMHEIHKYLTRKNIIRNDRSRDLLNTKYMFMQNVQCGIHTRTSINVTETRSLDRVE